MPPRGLPTTTIGAYPKPDYLPLQDWFTATDGMSTANATRHYTRTMAGADDRLERLFVRAAADVISDQVEAGVDVPTDGEVRREHYVYYHCRVCCCIAKSAITRAAMLSTIGTARGTTQGS